MQEANQTLTAAIERFAVDSSTIKSVGYADGLLVVEFQNGHLYSYVMPAEDFEAFARAESKGSYFNKNIRGKFTGEKLTGACAACLAQPLVIGSVCACGGAVVAIVSKAEAARLER